MAIGRVEKAQNARYALSRLVAYLSPFRTGLIFVFSCVFIYTLIGLIGPYLMGVAIDQYIIPNRVDKLPQIALIMLATYLFNNIFQAIAGRSMAAI